MAIREATLGVLASTAQERARRLSLRSPAEIIIDEVDFGLILCDESGTQVVLANAWARAAVPGLDVEGAALPALLRDPVAALVEERGFLREYCRPIKLTIDTRRFMMRFKTLGQPGSISGHLLVLSHLKHRRDDVYALLGSSFGLGKRESDIAMMVRDGYRNEEIAEKLGIAVGTVKHYVHRIFTALEVRSRAELVRFLDRRARDTTQGS
jgi:DNA-binding CsgD family transcriptional regulator